MRFWSKFIVYLIILAITKFTVDSGAEMVKNDHLMLWFLSLVFIVCLATFWTFLLFVPTSKKGMEKALEKHKKDLDSYTLDCIFNRGGGPAL